MRHDFLDRYSRLASPVHKLPASLKLITALIIVIAVVSTSFHHPWFFSSVLIFLLVVAAVSRIPWSFILGRLLLLEPFVLGVALISIFESNGFEVFLGIFVKSSLCLFAMILTSNTSSFSELLNTMRRGKVPSLLITVLALAYRYLFVLIDEGERMQRARRSRTFESNKRKRWYSLATLIGELFVRSTERAERIYAAMASRGWK